MNFKNNEKISMGEHDSLVNHIGGKKKSEQDEQLKQFERINESSKSNPYLHDMKKETNTYIKQSKTKKLEKIEHLEKLVNYIDNVFESGLLTQDDRINALKYERKRIKKEITKLKNR